MASGQRVRSSKLLSSKDDLVAEGAHLVLDVIQGRRSIPDGSSDRTPLWFVDAARGEMSSAEAVPDLIEALQSESPTRRENAAFALGAYQHPDIVPALVEWIPDQENYRAMQPFAQLSVVLARPIR